MPVWAQALVVVGTWAAPASIATQGWPSHLWGPWTLSLRASHARHFSGKYKKPSSGRLEGMGLGSKVWTFLLLIGFNARLIWQPVFYRTTPGSFFVCFSPGFGHTSSQCPEPGKDSVRTGFGGFAMGSKGKGLHLCQLGGINASMRRPGLLSLTACEVVDFRGSQACNYLST